LNSYQLVPNHVQRSEEKPSLKDSWKTYRKFGADDNSNARHARLVEA